MGRPKKENTKIVTLPSDPVERARLNSQASMVCDIMLQIDSLKQQLDGIITDNVERGYDRPTFKSWCTLMYDRLYGDNKKIESIDASAERISEVDLLISAKRDAKTIVDSAQGE